MQLREIFEYALKPAALDLTPQFPHKAARAKNPSVDNSGGSRPPISGSPRTWSFVCAFSKTEVMHA